MKKRKKEKLPIAERVESFLESHQRVVLTISLLLTVLFSFALFNLRISEGGDDSAYISRAMDLLSEGRYPSYQGPLYPFFLSVVLLVAGFHLPLLKITSLLFIVASQYLLYRALRNRVSYTTLFAMLLITSVNSWYLFFASQTYSEAMFIFIQNLFVLLIVRFINDDGEPQWRTIIADTTMIGVVVVLAFLSRTAGVGLAVAAVVTMLAYRRNKETLIFSVSVVVLILLWLGIRSAVWLTIPNSGKQLHELMQKHPYDSSEGEETLTGFGQRFADNSNLYLSKHFVKMIGFKDADNKDTNPIITILLYSLFVYGMVISFRQNRTMFFVGVYIAVMLGITFFSLQKLWDQYRLIIPFFPLMLLFVLYSAWQLVAKLLKGRYLWTLLLIVVSSFALSASQSFAKADTKTLISNLKGNKYEGYTPDWENFLKMSEYVGRTLKESDYVACRKPDMARLYAGGKKFYGIFRFDSEDADELLNKLRDKKVTHILLASLRKNPQVSNGEVINTLHRYMAYIAQKYPNIFILDHQIGSTEQAYLFRIDYSQAAVIHYNQQ